MQDARTHYGITTKKENNVNNTNTINHGKMTTEEVEHEVGRIALSDDAPTVNLNMFVLENKGLSMQNQPEMGRAMVADRDFGKEEVGSPILIENPCLVCQQND